LYKLIIDFADSAIYLILLSATFAISANYIDVNAYGILVHIYLKALHHMVTF